MFLHCGVMDNHINEQYKYTNSYLNYIYYLLHTYLFICTDFRNAMHMFFEYLNHPTHSHTLSALCVINMKEIVPKISIVLNHYSILLKQLRDFYNCSYN